MNTKMIKMMESDVDIKIELSHGYYKVSGNLSKKIPWNRIRGYMWYGDDNVIYHCVPIKKKIDLWKILKIYETGKKAIGPKGIFVIE